MAIDVADRTAGVSVPEPHRPFRATLWRAAGLPLGCLTAVVGLGYAVLGAPALLVPRPREWVLRGATALATRERERIRRHFGTAGFRHFSGHRALGYLLARSVVGALGMAIGLLILAGAAAGAVMTWQVATGRPIGGGADPDGADWYDPLVLVGGGAVLLYLAVQGLRGVVALDWRLTELFLRPASRQVLRRLSDVIVSRADMVKAVDEERRRIERDLHDGVQQRLVALGMLIGRARRAREEGSGSNLLRQAHEEAQQALRDLRDVAWRVYPAVLDSAGLRGALESLAEQSSVPVELDYQAGDVDETMETTAYFVVSEGVANATKHAAPSRIRVAVATAGTGLHVRVVDDGGGGADVTGSGLSGLARRVRAVDGSLRVSSPAGGPTELAAWLPLGR
ncbi:Histidine kinase [Amycolatopsis arida]|uniref:histidine kinase n=2 Tax=Amycolatopsis arida TaxID=587909 RepID=A0A1I6A5F8_9PSEU|nr:histidine kinase [Amycolatopsis arida]SFQ63898.1 Histidine kinase [Amycolatopsis arida]